MMSATFFLAPVFGIAGLTMLATAVLRRPMSDILAELCGGRQRGDFWVALGSFCTLLAAMAASMVPDAPLRHPGSDIAQLLRNAILQCAFGLAEVLVSLFAVSAVLFVFILRFERQARTQGDRQETVVVR